MNCFYCGAISFIKNGIIRGKQRYLCKKCGNNQMDSDRKEITKNCKRLAVILYLNGVKICSIARLFRVSHVTVLKWLFKYRHELDYLRKQPDMDTTIALQSLAPLSKPLMARELQLFEKQVYSIINP